MIGEGIPKLRQLKSALLAYIRVSMSIIGSYKYIWKW